MVDWVDRVKIKPLSGRARYTCYIISLSLLKFCSVRSEAELKGRGRGWTPFRWPILILNHLDYKKKIEVFGGEEWRGKRKWLPNKIIKAKHLSIFLDITEINNSSYCSGICMLMWKTENPYYQFVLYLFNHVAEKITGDLSLRTFKCLE